MRRLTFALGAAALAVAFHPGTTHLGAQERQSGNEFRWSQEMQPGSWLRIRNLNGAITVEPASGSTAEVVAVKHWRRGDPEDVRIEVTKNGDDVLICALWNEDATCSEDGYRSNNRGDRDRGDVSVEFTVRLPRGVRVLASSVNGAVEVGGATSEVVAHSVNGRVEATSSGGPVEASTVNGSLVARMGTVPPGQNLSYSTVNGSVTLELPADFAAEVDLRTVNGSLRSDFPLQVSGTLSPRRIHATIGDGGGRRLKVSTVNGSVTLRKTGD